MKIVLFAFLFLPFTIHASIFSVEEWMALYLRPCTGLQKDQACFDKTKRNFKRMLKHKDMMFKHLDNYNLQRWLATIPFVESEYTANAISKSGAVGLWQIMPLNLQHYMTKRRTLGNTIVITMPTIRKAKKKGLNPKINTEIAAKMLKHLYEKYGKGSHEKVVMAYNAGEFRIDCQAPKSKSLALKCAARGILRKPLTDETMNYYSQLMAIQMMIDDMTDGNVYGLR